MALSRLLGLRQLVDCTAEMAERVAGRSRMAVWQRVKDGLPALGPVEARGYIRARALGVVKEETSRLIEQEGTKVARQSSRIEAAATELLITTMVGQAAQRPAAQTMRRAA
jgi:hypothetical protein